MADSPSKTGRPDARDRRGNVSAARGRHPVRVRARAPSALAARRSRGTACLGARSGVPQGDPAVLVGTLVSGSAHFFVGPVSDCLTTSVSLSVARFGASPMAARVMCVSLVHKECPRLSSHPITPRGAFSFRRDTPRIEPPSRARATVASNSHPAATARERASLARPRAGLAASRAAHVGAGARVRRPLRAAGCD